MRIYLFAGHELMLETLRAALDETSGFECVGAAGRLSKVFDDLERLDVDVIIIEASDTAGSLEQVRELADARPDLKLLTVGVVGAREAVGFLEAGASGYLLQKDSWSRVREVAEGILAGKVACGPRVAALVYRRITELSRADELYREGITRAELSRRRGRGGAESSGSLSRRETQVLRLLALGLRNKEIARHLGIALSTAANHVQKVLEKLGTHRRRDAVRHACRLGLVEMPAA